MASHNTKDVKISLEDHSVGTFLSKLRDTAPASLVFTQQGISFLAGMNNDAHRVADLHKFSFNLQKIQRRRRKWVLHYNARDNNGIGEVVASLALTVGEIATHVDSVAQPPTLGMRGELTSYLPAKTSPFVPGLMEPCAVVTMVKGSQHGAWLASAEPTIVSVEITGSDPGPSERLELGLTEKAEQSLKRAATQGAQKKHYRSAQGRGEERRWVYPSNWKEWPTTLNISSTNCPTIDGVYKRAPCRQTVNQSALWIREECKAATLYLIIKPNIGRTGPDAAVISSSISSDDFADVLVTLHSTWQPCDALLGKNLQHTAKKMNWTPASQVLCSVVTSNIEVVSEAAPPAFISLRGLSPGQVNMLHPFESLHDTIKLKVDGGVESQKIIRSFNYLCVPPILRHSAQSEILSRELSPTAEWKPLFQKPGAPRFGFCEETIPTRPHEEWNYDKEHETWKRSSSPEDSREYYRRLQEAKMSFEFILNRVQKSLSIHCYPEVAAHFAARFLLGGRGIPENQAGVLLHYRLADLQLQSDPSYAPFKVFPCRAEAPTNVGLKAPYQLYERQQRVVTKMSTIEAGKMTYKEIEMAEHYLPGSTGFSLIAKASRDRQISGGVIADAIGAGKTVISIAMILQGQEHARKARSSPRKTGATLVVVPSGLINQWKSEIDKFTTGLTVICIHDTNKLRNISVEQIIGADVVIAPVDILESKDYTKILSSKSGFSCSGCTEIPELPDKMGQVEKAGVSGVWIPATSRDPYGRGTATEMKNQRNREVSAFFTHSYQLSIEKLRHKDFKSSDKGIPLEYFEWERVIVDEIHECLMSEKDFLELDWFKEKNRRASRELLGISEKDITKRPLVYRKSIYGLTGTPLLDNSNRVIELANLIGCTYIIGLASHWRKLERESRRDIFLQQFLEPTQSREIRKAIYSKCQEYLKTACCRNTTEKELEGIEKVETTSQFRMTAAEKDAYIQSQHGIDHSIRGLGIRPENFDPSAGHDISKFLKQNADSPSRGKALVERCRFILSKDPTTKIVVFADGRIGAGHMARKYLDESGLGCTCLESGEHADVELQNETISFYQRADMTEEDRARPRVLVLHFEHAAGLNLQSECYNMIFYSPLYVGDGGITGDPVSDASTEQQAIGRIFRPGQLRPKVFVHRLEMQGPEGEACLDGYLIGRTTNKETLDATTNAAEEEDPN